MRIAKGRNKLGIIIKNGHPVCGHASAGVSSNTPRILALPQAKALAKRIGGEAQEIFRIYSVNDAGDEYVSRLGEDWGTK